MAMILGPQACGCSAKGTDFCVKQVHLIKDARSLAADHKVRSGDAGICVAPTSEGCVHLCEALPSSHVRFVEYTESGMPAVFYAVLPHTAKAL